MNRVKREILKAILVGIIIFIVLQLINIIISQKTPTLNSLKWNLLYALMYSMVLYFANAIIFILLDKFFEKNRFHLRRLIIGFLASFVISGFAIFFLRIVEDVFIEKRTFAVFLKNETPSNYITAMVITVIVSLLIHLIYFYKAFQENRVKQEKIIAGNASAQFESLKNQLDPHFLFNSLNVLSSLIEENPENAQKFTTSLSKIYRYVLEQKDKELVSLAEELQFAMTYMNLLKMRFESSITFELPEAFENEEAKVIPLALQLLLENTIKHNVVSEYKPLHIKILVFENQLIVENNLQKKDTLMNRKGVGLQNIVDRYLILTIRKVVIEETENIFRIKLPILTKQLNIMETSNNYTKENAYYRATKRVNELKEFYSNLISYCIVIPFLIFINYKTTNFQWFWFPMLGWGMGLAFHSFAVFGYGKSWEEKKIQEFLKENDNMQNWK